MITRLIPAVVAALVLPVVGLAQQKPADPLASVPRLQAIASGPGSELADVVARFTTDQASLTRRYDAPDSPDQRRRMREFYSGWQTRLKELDFDKMGQEGKVDYVLLNNYLVHQLALLDRSDRQRAEEAALLPFADRLLALQDSRRNLQNVDPRAAARTLSEVTKVVDSLRGQVDGPAGKAVSKTVANRAADDLDQVRGTVRTWFRYYDGYDPIFSWWVKDPQGKLDEALTR